MRNHIYLLLENLSSLQLGLQELLFPTNTEKITTPSPPELSHGKDTYVVTAWKFTGIISEMIKLWNPIHNNTQF